MDLDDLNRRPRRGSGDLSRDGPRPRHAPRAHPRAARQRAAHPERAALPTAGCGEHAHLLRCPRWSAGSTRTAPAASPVFARSPAAIAASRRSSPPSCASCCSTSGANIPSASVPLILDTLDRGGLLRQGQGLGAHGAAAVRGSGPAASCRARRGRDQDAPALADRPARSALARRRLPRDQLHASAASRRPSASTGCSMTPPATSSPWRRTRPRRRSTCSGCSSTRCAARASRTRSISTTAPPIAATC